MKVDELPRVGRLHTTSRLFGLHLPLHLRPESISVPWLGEVEVKSCPELRSSHDKEVALLQRICQVVGLEAPCNRAEDPVEAGKT